MEMAAWLGLGAGGAKYDDSDAEGKSSVSSRVRNLLFELSVFI